MNYQILFKDLSVKEFNTIAENWYARLNKLKAYFIEHKDSSKAQKLIYEMIERMRVISFLYIQVNVPPAPIKKYKSGGVMVEEEKREFVVFNGEKII